MFGDSHGNVVHLFERDCSPATPPPEGDRGSPRPRHGRGHARRNLRRRRARGRGGRLRWRGHHRIHRRCQRGPARRPHLLHGNEHPASGRTPRHRGNYRGRSGRMAIARRERGADAPSSRKSCRSTATRSKRGFMPKTRRRGSCRARGGWNSSIACPTAICARAEWTPGLNEGDGDFAVLRSDDRKVIRHRGGPRRGIRRART